MTRAGRWHWAPHQLGQVRNRGALGVLVPVLALFAAARAWLGDHAGAFADAGEAAELGDQLGYAADAAVAVEMLAWQSAARGLHEDARTALSRARSLTDRAGTTGFAAHQALTAAFCALCRADPAAAVSLLEARVAADGGVGSMGEPFGVAPYLVEAYLAVGRRDEAIARPSGSRPSLRRMHRRGCGRWCCAAGGSPPRTRPPYRRSRRPCWPMRRGTTPSKPPGRSCSTAPGCAAAGSASRRGSSCAPRTTRSRRWTSPPGSTGRRRTRRHRGQAAYPSAPAHRAAHLAGDAGGPARGERTGQQGDRRRPVPQSENGRAPSQQRLSEAQTSAPAPSSPGRSGPARTAEARKKLATGARYADARPPRQRRSRSASQC